jgi:hypothetical protein
MVIKKHQLFSTSRRVVFVSLFNFFNNGKAEWEEIIKLKKQLVDVGFAPDEVNYMIKKQVGKKSCSKLSRSELLKIKEALVNQLEISHKCLNLIKES